MNSLLCIARIETLLRLVESGPDGEIWECGVYKGGSAWHIAHKIRDLKRATLFRLFDTFTGLKGVDPSKGDVHLEHDFWDVDFTEVERGFAPFPFVHIHRGRIPETFNGLEDARLSLVHVDVDIYDSVRACLEFVVPRLHARGTIVVDDYHAPQCLGAKRATDEAARELNLVITPGASCQVLVTKRA